MLLAMKHAILAGYPETSAGHIENISNAIAAVTVDHSEAETLLKIARYEGGFSQDVAGCKIKSSHGAVGPWQIIPISKEEKTAVCESLPVAAANALEKMRASKEACHWNHSDRGPWELDVYVSGKCGRGRSYSTARWGDGKALGAIVVDLEAKQERDE